MPCELRNLSRVCRLIYGYATPILFDNLELKIPPLQSNLRYIENLLSERVKALDYTTHLRITMRPFVRWADQVQIDYSDLGESGILNPQAIPKRSVCPDLNRMIRLLIEKIPPSRLKTFK